MFRTDYLDKGLLGFSLTVDRDTAARFWHPRRATIDNVAV